MWSLRGGVADEAISNSEIASPAKKHGGLAMTILLALLPVLLSSCASAPRVQPPPPLPAEFHPEQFQIENVGPLLRYKHDLIQTLSAEVNIRFGYDEEGRETSVDAVLAYERPDRLYVRGYNKYIPKLFELVVRGDRFWFYLPGDGLVLTGTEEALREPGEINLELNGFDILDALAAAPLKTPAGEKTRKENFYVVNDYERDEDGEKRLGRTLWINASTLDIERELHYTRGGIQDLEIERSEYLENHGWRMPKFLSILRLREQRTTVIMFWDTRVNVPVSEELFNFQPPANARVEEL